MRTLLSYSQVNILRSPVPELFHSIPNGEERDSGSSRAWVQLCLGQERQSSGVGYFTSSLFSKKLSNWIKCHLALAGYGSYLGKFDLKKQGTA